MWAYNRLLNVTVNGRSSVLSSVWQQSPCVAQCAFSTARLQNIHLLTQRPLFIKAVFWAGIQGKIIKKGIHVSRHTQRDFETKLAKDVMVFKYDNQKLYRIITLFGIVNYLMLMSVSSNIYFLLTSPPKSKGEESKEFDSESGSLSSPIYPETNHSASTNLETTESSGESEASNSSTLILKAVCGVTFVLGAIVLVGSWIYCNNVVRYIVLLKGGQKVTVVTHGFFAMNRYYTCEIDKVSCRGNRAISSAVLLNAKGRYFPFILDKKGVYTNPPLFDATVGVLRDLK